MAMFWNLLSHRDEALQPRSQFVGSRLFKASRSIRYHTELRERDNRIVLCGCMMGIRGVHGFNKLGAKRRRDYRWADRYRCWGRLPDRADRW